MTNSPTYPLAKTPILSRLLVISLDFLQKLRRLLWIVNFTILERLYHISESVFQNLISRALVLPGNTVSPQMNGRQPLDPNLQALSPSHIIGPYLC